MSPNDPDLAELTGSHGVGWIDCDVLNHVIINFFTASEDRKVVHNTYVYLLLGHLAEADVRCEPSFPDLVRVEQRELPGNPRGSRKWIKLHFARGSMAFFFEQAAIQRWDNRIDEPLPELPQ